MRYNIRLGILLHIHSHIARLLRPPYCHKKHSHRFGNSLFWETYSREQRAQPRNSKWYLKIDIIYLKRELQQLKKAHWKTIDLVIFWEEIYRDSPLNYLLKSNCYVRSSTKNIVTYIIYCATTIKYSGNKHWKLTLCIVGIVMPIIVYHTIQCLLTSDQCEWKGLRCKICWPVDNFNPFIIANKPNHSVVEDLNMFSSFYVAFGKITIPSKGWVNVANISYFILYWQIHWYSLLLNFIKHAVKCNVLIAFVKEAHWVWSTTYFW